MSLTCLLPVKTDKQGSSDIHQLDKKEKKERKKLSYNAKWGGVTPLLHNLLEIAALTSA